MLKPSETLNERSMDFRLISISKTGFELVTFISGFDLRSLFAILYVDDTLYIDLFFIHISEIIILSKFSRINEIS